MTVRERLSDWWYYGHQRGVLMHCEGTFLWCWIDNVTHDWLRMPVSADLWICRKHDAASTRAHYRKLHRARARRIRRLGWGNWQHR